MTTCFIKTIPVELVLKTHEHLTSVFHNTPDPISPPGVKDMGLLESAVCRQQTGSGSYMKYDSPFHNAASLIYGLCHNHPFHNGNKRTALLAGLMHLDMNGCVLDGVSRNELYDLMVNIAAHDIVKTTRSEQRKGKKPTSDEEIAVISSWLRTHSRRITKGEKSITYHQLYDIIHRFGYIIGDKDHNKVEILKKTRTIFGKEKIVCVYKASCPGDSRIVSLNEIKQIREALHLTEATGIDSTSFYDTHTILDSFIQEHRTVLRRLAKT